MHAATLLPLLALPFLSLTTASTSCFQSYYGHSCNGSIYGTANNLSTADISNLICCQGSSNCVILVDGSVTSCPNGGTALTLTNLTAIPTTSSSSAASKPTGASSSASPSATGKQNAAVRMTGMGMGMQGVEGALWVMGVVGLGVGLWV